MTYSPPGKAFKKQKKAIEKQEENKIKAIDKHGKQLAETNIFDKKDDFDTYDSKKKIIF